MNQKGIAALIPLVSILAIAAAIALAVYFLVIKQTPSLNNDYAQKSIPSSTSEPNVSVKSEYENPFSSSESSNPFSSESENPFDNLE